MQREWLLSLLRGYSEMGTQNCKRIQMISNDAYDSFVVVVAVAAQRKILLTHEPGCIDVIVPVHFSTRIQENTCGIGRKQVR